MQSSKHTPLPFSGSVSSSTILQSQSVSLLNSPALSLCSFTRVPVTRSYTNKLKNLLQLNLSLSECRQIQGLLKRDYKPKRQNSLLPTSKEKALPRSSGLTTGPLFHYCTADLLLCSSSYFFLSLHSQV